MKVYMIRHARTKANSEGRYVGIIDVPISSEGRKEAESLEPFSHIGKVYVSPMKRTRETADILFPDAEKYIIDNLKEMDFGRFEGRNHEELQYEQEYIDWIDRGGFEACPGGEEPEEFGERVMEGINEIIREARADGDEEVYVVTHGGVIMSIMFQLANQKGLLFDYMSKNCGGWAFEIEDFDADGNFEISDYYNFSNVDTMRDMSDDMD